MFLKECSHKASVEDWLRIETIFDQSDDSPNRLLYSGSIRNALQRLLPSDFFLSEHTNEELLEQLTRLLPVLKWSKWGNGTPCLSIILLCWQQINGVKFFYEMISRWLLPGKRPSISSFFATDFKLLGVSKDAFTLSEVVISLENRSDLELVERQLPILESEICLGLHSVYHANRILEIKGLSADEKTSFIQERITSLLKRRPNDLDHDIFTQMQHFLVMCSDEFKAAREYTHLSRLIYVFYRFLKVLRDQVGKHPQRRFVHVKLTKTCLHLPFGLKKVVGIFLGLNFLDANELFEERHFIKVLESRFSGLAIIKDSFFSHVLKEEKTQILYLEVEKEDQSDFSLTDMRQLREKLPEEIKSGIEKLTRPLFMPRNEEEVMRNIITLSNQLKFSRDLPQVIINFDTLEDLELSFTVIWLRVLKPTDLPLHGQFELSDSFIKFVPDRVKQVGMLRNKYPKEATVFRARFAAQTFLRSDHLSIDLFKARQALVSELNRIVGEFRDYNGGMIAKQHEQFLALKELLPSLEQKEELLLENFFHSIFPVEMRSLFNPLSLKKLFAMLLEIVQEASGHVGQRKPVYQVDDQHCYFLCAYQSSQEKEEITQRVQLLQIPDFQLLSVELQIAESWFLGYIYLEKAPQLRESFLSIVLKEEWKA